MPLTGNPVDDVLIKNFNRLHYGSQDGVYRVYRPNTTKVRRKQDESLFESVMLSSAMIPYVYKTSPM